MATRFDFNISYADQLDFYAKIDKNTNRLSILLSSDKEDASLRGMIPSLYGNENYSLSETPDEFHKCYEYNNRKTLIYSILIETFNDLKEKHVVSQTATLSKNPSYKCSFSGKIFILGYYITAAEYDDDWRCFHNWPWGNGTDICKYHPEFYGCEYSDGWANIDFSLDAINTKNYYIYGGVYNDNGEESKIYLDDAIWLQQINWGGNGSVKYGTTDIPHKIALYGLKTWSVASAIIWMAIDANFVNATGYMTGNGSTFIDSDEIPDVLQSINLEKSPIVWPLNIQNIIFEDNFSTDKGWISSPPTDIVRDSGEENVHWHVDRSYDQRMYHIIAPQSDEINFSIDAMIEDASNNCNIDIGLLGNITNISKDNLFLRIGFYGGGTPYHHWYACVTGKDNSGNGFTSLTGDVTPLQDTWAGYVPIDPDQWYTYELTKNDLTWGLKVYNKTTNALVGSLTGILESNLSSLNYIYFGNSDTSDYPTADGKLDNVVLAASIVPEPSRSSIGDLAWNDLDKDGIQDPNENGIAGAKVNLFNLGTATVIGSTQTDENGKYVFNNLKPGGYKVEFKLLDGYTFSPRDQGIDDSKDSDIDIYTGITNIIYLDSNQSNLDTDAGMYLNGSSKASIGDWIWDDANSNGIQDLNEIGISGSPVILYSIENEKELWAGLTVTDSTGHYRFENLASGTYFIEFSKPDDYVFSQKDNGDDESNDNDANINTGRTDIFYLESNQSKMDIDAGMHLIESSNYRSIGDWAWEDKDYNGLQDLGEIGIANVLVQLYSKENDTERLIKLAITNSTGQYKFENISTGNYIIEFLKPSDYIFTLKNKGKDDTRDSDADQKNGKTAVFTIGQEWHGKKWDAGLHKNSPPNTPDNPSAHGTGILDTGMVRTPIELKIDTTDPEGDKVRFEVKWGDGSPNYFSDYVNSGEELSVFHTYMETTLTNPYKVRAKAYDIHGASTEKWSPAKDLFIKSGYVPVSDIGDWVWNDRNKNGIQDSGEEGIPGIKLHLYKDYNEKQEYYGSTVTNNAGHYEFSSLEPGSYWIEVINSSNYLFSPKHQGDDPSKGSDVDPITRKIGRIYCSGQQNMDYDAGMYHTASDGSSIGDLVWNDLDRDGIQDLGEPGFNNILVSLYKSNIKFKTTTTNLEGWYLFDDLAEGEYKVKFSLLDGFSFSQKVGRLGDSSDSDVNTGSGETNTFYLNDGEKRTDIDAGMFQTNQIDHLGSLNLDLGYINNNVYVGEQVPITGKITFNGNPVVADIEFKINDQTVESATGIEHTYQFVSFVPGDYRVDVTASYEGSSCTESKKIAVIGVNSKALFWAEKIKQSAYQEINQAETIPAERSVKSYVEFGTMVMAEITGRILDYFIKPVTIDCLDPSYTDDVIGELNLLSKLSKYTEDALKKAEKSYISNGFPDKVSEATWMVTQKFDENYHGNTYRNLIDLRYQELVNFINANPKKFDTNNPSDIDNIFNKNSEPIHNVVETYDLYPTPSLPFIGKLPTTMKVMANFYDQNDIIGKFFDSICFAAIIILAIALLLFIVSNPVGWSISPFVGMALAKIAILWKAMKGLTIVYAIFKLIIVILLITSLPIILPVIENSHSECVFELINELTCLPSHEELYITANDTLLGTHSEIKTSSNALIVTPDGRITRGIRNQSSSIAGRPGSYSVFAYQHNGSFFSKIAQDNYKVFRPNVILNTSYAVEGSRVTVILTAKNYEDQLIENLTLFLTITNSSQGLVDGQAEFLSLGSNESKTYSYTFDLLQPDIYTASAELSLSLLNTLDRKTFPIFMSNMGKNDAAILDVIYEDEYSPYGNITLNITLESYAPELAMNLSIPSLSYCNPIKLSGTKKINLSIPRLPPDYYMIGIFLEKDGIILDSRIISFYVKAESVGFLSFNTNRLVYDPDEPIPINITLKDLNMTNIDATVRVSVNEPSGERHDYIATETDEGYQFIFVPDINGTYSLETHAEKKGYIINNNTLDVIVGQMSALDMKVILGEQIIAKVSANSLPAACKVTMYTEDGNTCILTTDGIASFNASDKFYLIADKMFFEPAAFSYINGLLIETSVNPLSAAPGANINLKIIISNIGNYSFNEIKAIDYLPSNMSYLDDSNNGLLFESAVFWNNLGPLPVGESITINLNARLDENATGYLDNLVEAYGIVPIDETKNLGSSAQDSSTVRVLKPGIEIEKTLGLEEPVHYGQYCAKQRVSGTGVVDVSASMVDKKLALKYSNSMTGDGDIELESENAISEKASKIQRSLGNNTTSLNLYEDTKLTYSGETPLSSGKYLESMEFFGGIGARIQEAFSVDEIEMDQQTFFASTDPTSNEVDQNKSDQLRNASSTHLVALETRNTFNGTWDTDAIWHKIFYKDVKAHEMFTGTFEAEKLIKFHENPAPEEEHNACRGIDC